MRKYIETIILLAAAGLFILTITKKPEIVETTLYMPVDSQAIIQKATEGMILYDYDALVKEFGNIFKDTTFEKIPVDSLILKDSTVIHHYYLPAIWSDSTFHFTDSTDTWRYKFFMDLHTTAFLPPISVIKNEAVLRDFTIHVTTTVDKTPLYKNPWYYVGIGAGFITGALITR